MKAFVAYGQGRCGLTDMPKPSPMEGEVLVKVGAASICHSDLDIIDGRRTHSVRLPVVLGHEFAGVVDSVGPGVVGLEAGARVACECIVWCGACRACRNGETSCCESFDELGTMRDGGFAEYAAVPARLAHRVHSLGDDEASNMEPAGNGFHAALKASIREGDAVAVIGPGPIGLYAMQFAAAYRPGALIMVGTRADRLEAAKELGATHTVLAGDDAYGRVMGITGGKGVDRVIQCATTGEAVTLALRVMGPNSILAMEGYGGGGTVGMDMDEFIRKPMQVRGVSGVSHR
ncbi:MAG: alcohol dehydrogenase catalytic domain-containing protein, partial [Oscillospiraceae bacterium]|nr:alcohol dehydrogenase catalytic domain-containing protein [Oscillospiraceae bacterium]